MGVGRTDKGRRAAGKGAEAIAHAVITTAGRELALHTLASIAEGALHRTRKAASKARDSAQAQAQTFGAHRVLYVHGIGNKPLASILKCQWDMALFGFDLGERSRLAYWINRERYPHPEPGNCSSGDLTPGEDGAGGTGIKGLDIAPGNQWMDAQIAELTADPQQAAFLKKLATHVDVAAEAPGAPAARDKSAKVLPLPAPIRRWITRRLTKAFLRDVHDLFFVPERRQLMLQSVYERLEVGGGPFVVVGHSQGSMVAYLALSLLKDPDLEIPLFVTIGSPLGIKEVQDQLQKILATTSKLPAPPRVKRWINVADRLDPVALDARLAGDFAPASGVRIEDFRVTNPDSPRHPHSATGYLKTEPVRKHVREAVDIALFQPVADFVIARDVARALENSEPEQRHEVLIELAELRGDGQGLGDVRSKVCEAIAGIRDKRKLTDDDYVVEPLERFVAARLTRDETELLAGVLAGTQVRDADRAIRRVWKNTEKRALLDRSINTVQVRPAHNAYRALGADVAWAVLDSGVFDRHPHFLDDKRGRRTLAATYDCTRRGAIGSGPAPDVHGHGTHVAGIIAGQLQHAGRTLCGMAPEAQLHIYKVLDDAGQGKDSWIIKALDHIAATNERAGRVVIHGVNLSLGGPFDPSAYACGHSPLCRELRRLWRQGVVVVVAAGNEGYALLQGEDGEIQANMPLTIGDPANLDEAIVVGSVHKENPHTYGGSYFSSRGPTADGRQKPDVVAPGERILSCRHRLAGARKSIGELYIEMSGTSMAAPHVSGLIAAFLSIHREFIGYPDKVKEKLLAACTDLGRERTQQGAGLPNLIKMLVGS